MKTLTKNLFMQVRMIYHEYGSKNYEFLKSKLNDDFLIERFNLLLEKMNDLVSVIMSTYNSEAQYQLH